MDKKEYKILVDDATTVQKILNQWKHEYDIDILNFSTVIAEEMIIVSILLIRTRKG